MQKIEAVLFEPVGCLAEFPSEPFLDIAVRLFGRKNRASPSGSRAYWHLLNCMEGANRNLDESERRVMEALEVEAAAAATAYEDVIPALSELKTMSVRLVIASSLSAAAVAQFLQRNSLKEFFGGIWSRNTAGEVKAAPLRAAIGAARLEPGQAMFITDTLEGLNVAKSVGVQSILMMNDPDEALRLAMHDPAGGIVSLHELPDFIRLVAAEHSRKEQTS